MSEFRASDFWMCQHVPQREVARQKWSHHDDLWDDAEQEAGEWRHPSTKL